jgi:hypothetical protein
MTRPDVAYSLSREVRALRAWQRFRRTLNRSAKEQGIVVPPVMWNGIRNAWRDGYLTAYETWGRR